MTETAGCQEQASAVTSELRRRFLDRIEAVVQKILGHHRSLDHSSGFTESAWNRKAWLLCATFSVSSLVSKFSAIVPPSVMGTLGMDEITLEDLRQRLPLVKPDDSRTTIYLIIGHNVDGRWALYVGSTNDIRRRVREHNYEIIQAHKYAMDAKSNDIRHWQYCHTLLAEDGWQITYHTLAAFSEQPNYIWKHMSETVFMILLGSMDKDGRGRYHNNACAKFLNDIEATVLNFVVLPPISASESYPSSVFSFTSINTRSLKGPGGSTMKPTSCPAILRLNRCLPIKQGFDGRISKVRNRTSNLVCDRCSTTSSAKWYYGNPGTAHQAYLCINCHREPRRTKADQERLETMRHMLLTHPDLDKCDYCEGTGGRMKRHLATGMLLCAPDYGYYLKHRELPPYIALRQELPVLDACSQCGSTHALVRHLPTRSVLCLTCSDQYQGPENPLMDSGTLKRFLPEVDECSNCGKTSESELFRCRQTQSVLCNTCHRYYQRNGEVPEQQRSKESLGTTIGAMKRLFPEVKECSNCASTTNLIRHGATRSVLCRVCMDHLKRNDKLPAKKSLHQLLPVLDECSNCHFGQPLLRHGATQSVLCSRCYHYYEKNQKLPSEPSLMKTLPVLDKCNHCGSTERLGRHRATMSVLCSKHMQYYDRNGHLPS